MKTNCERSEKCHLRCHKKDGISQNKPKIMVYKSEYVLKAFNELFEKKKRPLCLADFKEYFGIREKRDSKSINKALQKG